MTENASAVFVPPTIEHSDWNATEDRLLLFTITKPNPAYDPAEPLGTDEPETIATEYTMPNKPHPGLGLAFLRMARIYGIELAQSWLLEEAVGTEGYFALAAESDTTLEMLGDITRKVRAVVLGGLPKAP